MHVHFEIGLPSRRSGRVTGNPGQKWWFPGASVPRSIRPTGTTDQRYPVKTLLKFLSQNIFPAERKPSRKGWQFVGDGAGEKGCLTALGGQQGGYFGCP